MDFRELNTTIGELQSENNITVVDILRMYKDILDALGRETGKNPNCP